MATFIKGLNDELPVYAPTQMDYSFLGKALDALQTRYDKSVDRWKSMYNSILNKELSSADNQQFRADYLKKADAYLKQVAMVDLTNAANMQQAMNLFDPLVNDKEYVTDLYKTSAQNAQIARNNQAKFDMAKDPTKSTYSPIMEKYLMIGKERLGETKRGDGSIEKAAVHEWSPWVNYYDYAAKLAKDQGLEITTQDSEGMYLVTRTNGLTKENLGTFSQWAKNATGNMFDNQFRVEAVVKADDAVKNLMAENKGMTKDLAIRQLAGEQSDAYVKEYNDDMVDLQQNIDMIDNEMRKYKKQYPNGVDPRLMDRINSLKEQKELYTDRLNNMRTGKISDADLKQKTMDMFVSSPGQMYYGAVKNGYAQQFAYNWAANSKVTKTPDQVKLQEDSQAHAWALEKWKSEQEDRRKQEDRDFEIEKMKLKGEITGITGVEQGQPLNIYPTEESVPAVQSAYSAKVVDLFNNSTKAYLNPINLAVAANFPISKTGGISWPGDIQNQSLISAINKKSKNLPITPDEAQSLQGYLNRLGGSGINVSTVQWPTLAGVITKAIRSSKYNDTEYGRSAFSEIQESNISRDEYASMSRSMKTHLETVLKAHPEYLNRYIVPTSLGGYTLNYGAINKEKNRDVLYQDLLPPDDRTRIAAERGKSMSSIVFNVTDPKQFDFGLYQRVIDNATEIGVTGTVPGGWFSSDKQNAFVGMSEEERQKFRQLAFGGKNLSEVFGTSGTQFYRQSIGGKSYVVAKVPVLRQASGKEPRTMADVLGFTVSSDVEKMNTSFLEFRIPLERASKLLGPRKVYKSGDKEVEIADPFRDRLNDMVGRSEITPARSWVSTITSSSDRQADFPLSMQASVDGRLYSVDDGRIFAEFQFDNRSPLTIDLTKNTGIRFFDLQDPANGANADQRIRSYIRTVVDSYDDANMSNSHNRIINNSTAARTNSEYIPWTDKRLNF